MFSNPSNPFIPSYQYGLMSLPIIPYVDLFPEDPPLSTYESFFQNCNLDASPCSNTTTATSDMYGSKH